MPTQPDAPPAAPRAENIRLLIWDLDETFWHGTVTEGGHRYVQQAHDTVVELARRGIMSAICSRNDHDTIRQILEDTGLWDYFIFPSINWNPKGARIAELIAATQLRPETVMFIDDNPSNRNEALHMIPALQVRDETFVPRILADPLFAGKDDRDLTRLAHYKLLERRKADQTLAVQAAGGSNTGFLRASNIRVRIERDIEGNIDRAIELINRTNQLNFTKRRLPEGQDDARAELQTLLNHHRVQAGLIEVRDDYGNHGFSGFYLTMSGDKTRLLHFCFSCRILGMGVEAWLYQRLDRPVLRIVGEVLCDPIHAEPVDWIAVAGTGQNQPDAAAAHDGTIAARGGCVLMPLVHYFAASASRVAGEYNAMRNGISIRLDHSLCFRHAMDGLTGDQVAAAGLLGYEPGDFTSKFFDHDGAKPIWIFSNWADTGLDIYRHRATGLRIPFRPVVPGGRQTPAVDAARAAAAGQFDLEGIMGEAEIKANLRAVFSRIPAHGRIYVLLPVDDLLRGGQRIGIRPRILHNTWSRDVAAAFDVVTLLRMADFIDDDHEIKENSGAGHFDRMVYFRLYQHIARENGMVVG